MKPLLPDERRSRLDSYDSGPTARGGGLYQAAVALTRVMLEAQERLGLGGHLVEIGVLEGRFSGLINHFRQPDEILFAIDPYYGPAGEDHPAMASARDWLSRHPPGLEGVVFLRQDSATVTPNQLRIRKRGVRFVHVDGDHRLEPAYQDFRLAGQILERGGILVVDDYYDRFSPGVAAALTKFMLLEGAWKFAPVASGGNKIFLTTSDHHWAYRKLLEEKTNFLAVRQHRDVDLYGHPCLMFDYQCPGMATRIED
jgi:hypothetical protein